jgi:hypothetical protein
MRTHERRALFHTSGERWFDKIPDREPVTELASAAPASRIGGAAAQSAVGQDANRRT